MKTGGGNGKFALVIPTLNEAGNIPVLLDRVQIALARVDLDYELLIVDDDSRDGTADIVNEFARRDPRVRWIVRRGARGLAGRSVWPKWPGRRRRMGRSRWDTPSAAPYCRKSKAKRQHRPYQSTLPGEW